MRDLIDPDPPQAVEQIDLPANFGGDRLEEINPTERHATRISSATAVLDVFTPRQQT